MAAKKVVQKLDCIKTVEGHEVYCVVHGEPLMILHEGHKLSELSK